MGGKRFILSLDNAPYELSGRSLRPVHRVGELSGVKMVFSDFEAAVPQIATVQGGEKYAQAVLEKQLRETGEIEAGGRVVVLLKRKRGQDATEVLYVTAPSGHTIEGELDRGREDSEYLLFPVQQLLADALTRLKPRRPRALMLISAHQVDVVVGDRVALYGAFRVSLVKVGTNSRLPSRNLETALGALERDLNIEIQGFECLYLLAPEDMDLGWIRALADARGIPCGDPDRISVDVDGARYVSSVLRQLHGMQASKSCSPRSIVNDYYANRSLPWVAAVMLTCCALALCLLVYRHRSAEHLASRIAALSASLDSSLTETPVAKPGYQGYLDTASRLAYAQAIPGLREVLGKVSSAARDKETQLEEVQVEYQDQKVVVTLKGWTRKSSGSDSMAFYNRFISDLRRAGYGLSKSDLDTRTRQIDFTMRLERPIQGARA